MISRELLSEVLGYEADPSLAIEVKGEGIFSPGINIHELAHKCKEWALGEEYTILSSNGYATVSGKVFYADTEPEAIFKACEWIMERSK